MTGNAPSFSQLTTMGVGGDPDGFISVESTDIFVEAIRATWAAGEPWFVLGSGSAVVASDERYPGVVILARTSVIDVVKPSDDRVEVTIDAGVPWDDFVQRAVGEGWGGAESLSGIPGNAGSAPIRNISAFGHQFADVAVSAEMLDEETHKLVNIPAEACDFSEKASNFGTRWKGIVTRVTVSLTTDGLSAPIAHPRLAAALGVAEGERVPVATAREAVMALREERALNFHRDDPDTVGCGPFFMDPYVSAEQLAVLPPETPHWQVPGKGTRVSAEWLVNASGMPPGFALAGSRVALSGRNGIAITNRGGAAALEVVDLARHVRDTVASTFDVHLEAWPRFVGLSI